MSKKQKKQIIRKSRFGGRGEGVLVEKAEKAEKKKHYTPFANFYPKKM